MKRKKPDNYVLNNEARIITVIGLALFVAAIVLLIIGIF
jgi:hypothetical protein